jgi:hypothetical protein
MHLHSHTQEISLCYFSDEIMTVFSLMRQVGRLLKELTVGQAAVERVLGALPSGTSASGALEEAAKAMRCAVEREASLRELAEDSGAAVDALLAQLRAAVGPQEVGGMSLAAVRAVQQLRMQAELSAVAEQLDGRAELGSRDGGGALRASSRFSEEQWGELTADRAQLGESLSALEDDIRGGLAPVAAALSEEMVGEFRGLMAHLFSQSHALRAEAAAAVEQRPLNEPLRYGLSLISHL